jgi:multiple sugar transport system substrate-binding protein
MAMSMMACGDSAGSESSDAGASTEGTATEMQGSVEGELTVCIWDENQRPGLQEIIDEWSAESGVKATIQVVGWDDYWTLLEAALQVENFLMYSGCTQIRHRNTWKTTCSWI